MLRNPFTIVLLAILAVVAAPPISAHEGEDGHVHEAVPEYIAHAPTAIPDRIVLTWTGDPATTQAVTWRTDDTVTGAIAEYAVAEGGPMFVERTQTIPAETTVLETDLGTAHFHTTQITGLQPNTRYLYRVGDSVNWSEWFQFRTASDKVEPFSFIYYGDAQNSVKSHWSRVIRQAFKSTPEARFMLHAGDLINSSQRDAEWGEWHYAGGWLNGMLPSIATPGNHEYNDVDSEGRRGLARHWRPQFAFPLNGPDGYEETTYYIDYQGVRIVSLNSNTGQLAQVPWIEKVLSDNPNRWTILTFHHPVYSAAKRRDNPLLRLAWKPIIDKYKVDLVLQGHDHSYARSKLIGENFPVGPETRTTSGGTMYVVSVSGPKMYEVDDSEWMQKSAQNTQLYQVISIEGDKLQYHAYTAHGDLYDAFELRKPKEKDAGNTLVELMDGKASE